MSAPTDSTETMTTEQREARDNMIRLDASIDCYKKRIAFDQQALAALEARKAELFAKSQSDSRVRRYTRALAEISVPESHIGLFYWGPVAPNITVVFCRLVRVTEIQECKSADPDKAHVMLVDNNRTLPVEYAGCNIVWIDPANEQHFAEAYRRVVSAENIPKVFGIEIPEYKVNGEGAFASSFRDMTDRALLAWTNDLQSIRTLTESHPRTSLVTSLVTTKVKRSATPQRRRPAEIAATEVATAAGTAAAAARMVVANMRGANRQSVDSSDEDQSTSGASAGTSQASSWVVHPREEDASVQSGATELQNLMTYSNLSAK